MTIELQNKLFEKYPNIFRQKDLDMKETAMCWGIECGDGWYNLIDTLCSVIQFNIEHNSYAQVEAVQVKEKWGTLRFYADNVSDYLEGMISLAEYMSGNICEDCGTNQNVSQNDHGWISTLCEDCRNKRNSK